MLRSTKILLIIGAAVLLFGGLAIAYFYLPGRAIIQTNATDAKFTLDGNDWTFKNRFWLKRGNHTIEATKDGCLTSTQVFEIKPIFSTEVYILLSKVTEISPQSEENSTADTLAKQRVLSGDTSSYYYLDESAKYISLLEDGKTTKVIELPFLIGETLTKFKWSGNRNQLFIRSFKDDVYYSRLINIRSKTISALTADTVDVAFWGSEFFSLKTISETSTINGKSGELAKISEVKNNLEYDGSIFYIFDKLIDSDSRTMYICTSNFECRKVDYSQTISDFSAKDNHAVAITVDKNYSLYDFTAGNVKPVDSDISPLYSWLDSFNYLKNGSSCTIMKYDFVSTQQIYTNANICQVDDFMVSQNKLYYRLQQSAYEMELK